MKVNLWIFFSTFLMAPQFAVVQAAIRTVVADSSVKVVLMDNNTTNNSMLFMQNNNGGDKGNFGGSMSGIYNGNGMYPRDLYARYLALMALPSNVAPRYETGWKVDVWLGNSPVSSPFLGLACSYFYCSDGVNAEGVVDNFGFYGVTLRAEDTRGVDMSDIRGAGALSDNFIQYIRNMPVSSRFSVEMNVCASRDSYNAAGGGRCKDTASGEWVVMNNLDITKEAHLTILNTNKVDEVFINSDGVPTPEEGNTSCVVQTVGDLSGLACKMVEYRLEGGGGGTSGIDFFPNVNNSSLSAAIGIEDVQMSLDGSSWKPTWRTQQGAPFTSYDIYEMVSSNAIYVFLSDNFFKQMVALGISDIDSRELIYFEIRATPGGYTFPTSNSLLIKPREFSISITSDEYSNAPIREGYVGSSQSALDFNYIVTTSGKTAADEVQIKVTGLSHVINGRPYCIFSSPVEPVDKVPFPATISFMTQNEGTKTYDVGCDGRWRDMTNALWVSSAWDNISRQPGIMDKATVKFSVLMNDIISLRTLEHHGWHGEVSASGEVHVQATWRDIN